MIQKLSANTYRKVKIIKGFFDYLEEGKEKKNLWNLIKLFFIFDFLFLWFLFSAITICKLALNLF